MGRILVEQPNGKWAVWSTVVDDFVLLDCDEADLFAAEVLDAARTWATDTERRVRRNRGGNSPKCWEECLGTRRVVHGHDRDFRDDPFDGTVEDGHPGDWTTFFESKLAELCGAYYAHLMKIREGHIQDPPKDVEAGNLYDHCEALLAQLVAKRRFPGK